MDRGLSLLIAVAIAVPLTAAARRIGSRLGLVDDPADDDLKIHRRPVPVLGGLAVILSAFGALALRGHTPPFAVLAAVGIALAAGLLDDARPQPARVQAVLQISAGIALVAGGIDLEPLGAAGPFAVVLLVVAGANGVNFVDGQDGLAGGLAALACLGLAGLAAAQADLALALAGALGAFLLWNRSPARIFLGNGGAQAVGTILAVLAIGAIDAGGWRGLVAASVCLTIFLFELVLTVIRRLGSRSLTTGDRLHSYDLLAEELGSRGRVTLAFWALGAAASAVALAVSEVPMTIAITTAVAVWGCSAVAGYLLWSRHSTGKAPRVRARRARSYVG